jgi:hypothetical protein
MSVSSSGHSLHGFVTESTSKYQHTAEAEVRNKNILAPENARRPLYLRVVLLPYNRLAQATQFTEIKSLQATVTAESGLQGMILI